MFPRPRPHRAFGVVRLALTTFLAVHVFISAWLVVNVEGVYTEGKPAPTEAHSLVAIDKDRTMIDIEIKRATSFFFYALERDGDASVPANTSSTSENNTGETTDGTEDGSSTDQDAQSDVEWLSLGRQSIKAALVALVLSELMMLSGFKWRHHLRTLFFLATLVAFSVVFPACYMLELSGDGEDEGDNTASNTPGANIETVSFVHTNSSSDFSLTWLGVQLEADFSGYDLGLVKPENRTSVAANVPEEGSKDASSFIAFESTFDIELGKNLDTLLVLPFAWYLLPARDLRTSPETAAKKEEE